MKPYELGWICTVEPENLDGELRSLRIGAEAIEWYREEIARYGVLMRQFANGEPGQGKQMNSKPAVMQQKLWDEFSTSFLQQANTG